MQIKSVEFIGSFPSVDKCPKVNRPEYAFIGRSNVGKSSLINMLCERKGLAKTSNTPGKTQLINYFLVNDAWYLVDLPGYGYAQISKKKRVEWKKMINGYFLERLNMQCAFILLDGKIPPQKIDMEFINWMGEMQVPFVLVYTKTDKLKSHEVPESIAKIQKEILKSWDSLPQEFITSSVQKTGRDEILKFIKKVNKNYA